jgi:anti-sigma B factor antagonist
VHRGVYSRIGSSSGIGLCRVRYAAEAHVASTSIAPNGSDRSWDRAALAEFRIEVDRAREVVRVCPIGELDLSTVEELRAQLEELKTASFSCMILDLRATTFLDSTGLGLVIEAHTTSADDGYEFAIFAGPPEVQRTFEVTGLSTRLPFADPRSTNGSTGDG